MFHLCIFQVPGRLGVLVTLALITTNVYNSVKAPAKRGFSFIEIWLFGVQIPILLGILEYGIILAMKKYHNGELNCLDKTIDKWAFIVSLLFIMIFNTTYWSIVLSASYTQKLYYYPQLLRKYRLNLSQNGLMMQEKIKRLFLK